MLFGRRDQGPTVGDILTATFTGRASAEMAMEAFGYLMQRLKLWETVKSAEDVALHNEALAILKEMRGAPSLNLKNPAKITILIEYERPDDAMAQVR